MIGFLFDGIKQTLRLPPEKATLYIQEAHAMLRQKNIPQKTLQKTVGKLSHAALILPAAQGFFTPLNYIMKSPSKTITLGAEEKEAVLDLITLICCLSKQSKHFNKIIPNPPSYVAYHDAAAEGAGGVWFLLVNTMQPMLWQVEFPQDIADNVISDKNPNRAITNSDLELAAEVLAVGIILAKAPTIKHHTLGICVITTPPSAGSIKWHQNSSSPQPDLSSAA